MGRKRNPYIQLFTRDILSSPRCRALSESAAGVYLFLLCRLNEPPTPGAYRISDWELHPTWKRSCTQQCLATADKQTRLQYFAKMLSKNDLPWKTANILSALQELYKYGIITVEGDMLIQPRMFKDNGFDLPDLDNDGDPVGTILDDPHSGSMALRGDDDFTANSSANNGAEISIEKGTEKVQKKVRVSRAGARTLLSVEDINNNSIDKGNKGVQGGDLPNAEQMQKSCKNAKTDKTTPESKNGDASAATPKKKKQTVADNPPTLEDVQVYFDERAQQGKPFIYVTPESFYDACCQSGWSLKDGKPMIDWRARVRTFENFRKEHGDKPTVQGRGQVVTPLANQPKAGDPVAATPTNKNKYKDKW